MLLTEKEGSVMSELIELVRTIDENLYFYVKKYGTTIYTILFFVAFSKTGFVITPFFPADSVMFVSGTLAAVGLLDIKWLILIFFIAAILGDSLNFLIGYSFKKSPKPSSLFFQKISSTAFQKATYFIQKYDVVAITFSRFILFIRTLIPFISAYTQYPFSKFLFFNSIGAVLWVTVWLGSGFLLGNISIVANNLTLSLSIITIGVFIPAIVAYLRQHNKIKKLTD